MSQAGTFGSGNTPPPPGTVLTLTGNTGGAVSPDGAGNINVIGNPIGSISVSDTPASHTLSIYDAGTQFVVAQTTDDTIEDLAQVVITTAATVTAQIIGVTADHSRGITGTIEVGARDNSGSAILIGIPDIIFQKDSPSLPGPSMSVSVSGSSLFITIAGEVGQTYNWTGYIRSVSSAI